MVVLRDGKRLISETAIFSKDLWENLIMRRQILILSLLLTTTTFSSLSFGEWELAHEGGHIGLYWDRDNVRTSGGLVYWYAMQDLGGIKGPDGSASMKWYRESNCQRLSFKDLNFTTYVQTMAKGKQNYTVPFEDSEVQYPEPESPWYALLSSVCDYVNSN